MICPHCENEIKYGANECPNCGLRFKYRNRSGASGCKRSTATYLALVFGSLGLHHFYLGYFIKGAIRLTLFVAFCGLFVSPLVQSSLSTGAIAYKLNALGICGIVALVVQIISFLIAMKDFVSLVLGDVKTDAKGLTLM